MKSSKLVLIGWDGATFDIVTPMVEAGRMPNLEGLIRKGSSGRLRSTIPALTPTAWSTIGTGVNPGKHGIFDAMLLSRSEHKMRFANASSRLVPTIWSLMSKQDITCGVFNVPLTFPAEAIRGYVVPGMFTPPDINPFMHPPWLEQELKGVFGSYEQECSQVADPAAYLELLLKMIERREAYVLYLMEKHPADFSFFTFIASDRVQHFFWKFLNAQHPQHVPFGSAIEKVFERLDEALGRILEKAGKDATVMMVSDHGMGPIEHAFFLNSWLVKNGYLHLKEDPSVAFRKKQTPLLKKIWLKLMRMTLPLVLQKKLDIDPVGRENSNLNLFLSLIDWEKTTVYSEGVSGAIYINEGAVSENDRPALADELIGKLKAVQGPDGRPVIKEIYRRDDLYSGAAVSEAGDLIVVCSSGYSLIAPNQFLYYGKEYRDELFISHRWSGGHEPEGIFVLSGHHARQCDKSIACSVVDVSPTVLYLMGQPVPDYMDGKVLTEAIDTAWLNDHPVRQEAGVSHAIETDETELTDEQEKEVADRLKSLGYME